VDAVQVRLICEPLAAVAVRPAGALGAVVSGACVVAVAMFEYGPRLPAASTL